MRPHHPEYSYIDLQGSDSDATLKYLLLAWPIVDPYARYRFVQETGNDRIIGISEGYFLTMDAMKEGFMETVSSRREILEA